MENERQTSNQPEESGFGGAEKYRDLADIKPETIPEPPSSLRDLEELKRPGKAIRTSGGKLFGGREDVWGRDSMITAEDLLNSNPEISLDSLIMLIHAQGTEDRPESGEKAGRIPTEYRKFSTNKELPFYNKENFIESKLFLKTVAVIAWQKRLGALFKYTNYYSSDTTPLFIDTAYKLARENPEILSKTVEKKDRSKETLKDSVIKAAEYVEGTVGSDGLIRIKEDNPWGNQFRYWRDSPNSYRDDKGKLPNILGEMVILDVQCLSAQSLEEASELIENESPEKAKKWRTMAENIRRATVENLWMENEKYFAYAMDADDKGELHPIKTIQSNAGWLLNSDFFDKMPENQKEKYISGIVKRLFSDEFLTNAGMRCRSLKHADDADFADYHGSWVSWPMDSYMIAKGLRRQGFDDLADQLETRIINAVNMAGVNYEFFVIDKEGKVLLDPKKSKTEADTAHEQKNEGQVAPRLDIELSPEHTIGWTVTASLRIKRERGQRFKDKDEREKPAWVTDTQRKIMSEIDILPVYKTREEINRHRYEETSLYLDTKAGSQKSNKNVVDNILIPSKKPLYALIGKLFRGRRKE